MRTDCVACRPDLKTQDTSKKARLIIGVTCSNKYNKVVKRDEKIGDYPRLCFELRERREGYTVKVTPTITGCLGGRIKELKESIQQVFEYDNNDREVEPTS